MTLQDLGALGKFVSAIVVVISLIYLAFQVRSNTKAALFDSRVKVAAIVTEHQKLLIDPEIARMWLRGLEDSDSLTVEERLGFSNLLYMLVNGLQLGAIGPGETGEENIDSLIPVLNKNPGFLRWWKQAKDHYTKNFRGLVDKHMTRE